MASTADQAEELQEEQRLIEEAQRGNLDAMRPIFERYAQPLYAAVILPRVGDRASAEDVLRDTLATAVEKLDRFRWQGTSIYAWLRRIAVNKATDHHRRTRRSQKLVDAMTAEMSIEPHITPRPDAKLIAAEEQHINRARIDKTLEQLNDRYRAAIRLRLIEELSREECAARLDITVNNFDVVLYRAVRAFRKRFGERELS